MQMLFQYFVENSKQFRIIAKDYFIASNEKKSMQ